MFKINNNSIYGFGFSLLAVLVFGAYFVAPSEAKAQFQSPYYDGIYYTPPMPSKNVSQPVKDNPIPSVFSVSPNAANAGSPAKRVVITGQNFVPGSVAKFNSSDRVTYYQSPSKLEMELTNQDMQYVGKHLITVWNPAPAGGYSNSVFFSVINSGAVTNTNNNNSSNNNTQAITTGATTASKSTTASTGKSTNVASSTKKTSSSATKTASTSKTNVSDDGNSLAATPIFGDASFLPDTLIEWFFLCVLLLFFVLLWRRIWVKEHQPLKHA